MEAFQAVVGAAGGEPEGVHAGLAPDQNQLSSAFQSRPNPGPPGHCPWLAASLGGEADLIKI